MLDNIDIIHTHTFITVMKFFIKCRTYSQTVYTILNAVDQSRERLQDSEVKIINKYNFNSILDNTFNI